MPQQSPNAFWEQRYSAAGKIWSGRVNAVLEKIAAGLTPARALDIGSGEGADVLWLASRGWDATGVEISATAVLRSEAAARAQKLVERAHFEVQDLSRWTPSHHYDLVTASFFQSPVELNRTGILRRAASAVAEGGHLLVTSHAAPPSWSRMAEDPADPTKFPRPQSEVESLGLDGGGWQLLIAEIWERPGRGPEGQEATMKDTVVLARRR
ncbi:bifunctional 2-polyprenyl-6-hydroxyphenol methylase/3-demethylubiquinol 3-O-methyltransferase UbiG [Anaeromyxobacter sp. Fw109-5]|uniref:class I SAM-dependent methyltransferase n=1 Tax=Anaeromyxobacter sp. (strain Fw109-5) TaxID=404589 RepID=UPI0000ED8AC3|nr:class I SAM-dependent methyltransferase [Anaeromyxobacter sp. Fw109-5]ABS27457.1 Methyltransferase type 12 [Anaeromyxobacter sp. Fw109-5]